MAEDLSKMKATKTSKKDNLNKLLDSVGSAISDNSNQKRKQSSSKSSSSKSSSNKNSSKSSSSKSNTQNKANNQSNTSETTVKRKRGRPRKYPLPEEQNIAEKVIDTTISKSANKVDKAVKKSFKKQGLSLILFFAFLFIGICGGFVMSRYVIFNVLYPNDTYEMVAYTSGDKTSYDIYIKQDISSDDEFTYSTYNELGVKCIAFGKDYSKDYTVKYYYRNDLTQKEIEVEKIDTTKEGVYYAVYSVKPTKYKYVKLIRNIIVLRGENDE